MNSREQIIEFIGGIIDLYRESEEIVIENNPGNMTADFEELETKCNELMYYAQKLVAQ